MAKNERKNRKVIVIINIIVSVLLIGFSIYNFKIYDKKLLKLEQLEKNYDEVELKFSDKNKENEELKDKINFLNNLDKETDILKQEIFSLAKDLEDDIIAKKSNKKIAYLTFDDGPYYLTHKYLDVLKKHSVKATFFTIGSNGEKCYDKKTENCYNILKNISDAGHTIGNHTYHHLVSNRYIYKSASNYITSLKRQENLIKDRTGGYITNITRFPGGSATAGRLKNSIINELRKNNYGWVDWTAQDGDGGYLANKTTGMNNLKSSINENIEVVLLHDYSNVTLAILPDIITYLESKGYILLPLFYESNMINK